MIIAMRSDELSLTDVLRRYWKLVLALSIVGTIAGITASILSTKLYRAEVIVATSELDSVATGTASQLAQMAGIAGLGLASGGAGYRQEALATLRSREIAREFIESRNIATTLSPKDGPSRSNAGEAPKEAADQWLNRVTDLFKKQVLEVRDDRRTGMLVVAIRWSEPVVAAAWANDFVRLADDKLRERRRVDADKNLKLLGGVIGRTTSVDLKQAMYRMYDVELQKKMQTQVRDSLFFRVIDPAVPPDRSMPVSPDVRLLVGGGGLLGFSAGFGLAVLLSVRRRIPTPLTSSRTLPE